MLTLYKKKNENEKYDVSIHKPVSILLDNQFQREKRFIVGIIPNSGDSMISSEDGTFSKTIRKTIVELRTIFIERLQNIPERFKEILDIKEEENLEEFAFQFNFKLRKRTYKFDEEDSSPWTSTELFSLTKDYDNILIMALVDKQYYHIGP